MTLKKILKNIKKSLTLVFFRDILEEDDDIRKGEKSHELQKLL